MAGLLIGRQFLLRLVETVQSQALSLAIPCIERNVALRLAHLNLDDQRRRCFFRVLSSWTKRLHLLASPFQRTPALPVNSAAARRHEVISSPRCSSRKR